MQQRLALITIIVQFGLAAGAAAGEGEAAAARDGGAMPAKRAGAHYGQALGAVDVCPGAKLTKTGKALEDAYRGADHERFLAAAASVFQAWQKVRRCSDTLDPNPCKIILDQSCATAATEIGAGGSVLPGLVDFAEP